MPLRANAYGGVGVVLRLWKENSGVTNPLVGTINLYQVGGVGRTARDPALRSG